jgi:hypothetical protein
MLLGFEIGQRWPEAVMHSYGSYFVPVPYLLSRSNGRILTAPALQSGIRSFPPGWAGSFFFLTLTIANTSGRTAHVLGAIRELILGKRKTLTRIAPGLHYYHKFDEKWGV